MDIDVNMFYNIYYNKLYFDFIFIIFIYIGLNIYGNFILFPKN